MQRRMEREGNGTDSSGRHAWLEETSGSVVSCALDTGSDLAQLGAYPSTSPSERGPLRTVSRHRQLPGPSQSGPSRTARRRRYVHRRLPDRNAFVLVPQWPLYMDRDDRRLAEPQSLPCTRRSRLPPIRRCRRRHGRPTVTDRGRATPVACIASASEVTHPCTDTGRVPAEWTGTFAVGTSDPWALTASCSRRGVVPNSWACPLVTRLIPSPVVLTLRLRYSWTRGCDVRCH